MWCVCVTVCVCAQVESATYASICACTCTCATVHACARVHVCCSAVYGHVYVHVCMYMCACELHVHVCLWCLWWRLLQSPPQRQPAILEVTCSLKQFGLPVSTSTRGPINRKKRARRRMHGNVTNMTWRTLPPGGNVTNMCPAGNVPNDRSFPPPCR